jgi:hypothetical protein
LDLLDEIARLGILLQNSVRAGQSFPKRSQLALRGFANPRPGIAHHLDVAGIRIRQTRRAVRGVVGRLVEPCPLLGGEVGDYARVGDNGESLRPQIDVGGNVRCRFLLPVEPISEETGLKAIDGSLLESRIARISDDLQRCGELSDRLRLTLRFEDSEGDPAPVRGTEQRSLHGYRLA